MNQITPYQLVPKSLNEAMELAKLIANSDFAPKDYRSKPGNVLIACQMGAELGLSPMQAIQNIAVINGRPCVWGDAALAIVQNSHLYVSHEEWMEGNAKDGTLTACCSIIRKGHEPYSVKFSIEDAKKANLWGKQGPWSQYPTRMLQMRARGFCLRDKFADALKGLNIREEVEDYQVMSHKKEIKITTVQPQLIENKENELNYLNMYIESIRNCETNEQLREDFTKSFKWAKSTGNDDYLKEIIKEKDAKKLSLDEKEKVIEEIDIVKEFNDEIDQSENSEENE